MKRLKLITLLVAFLSAKHLLGSVAITFEFEALRDSAGIPLSAETFTILVADTNKDSNFPIASDLFGSELSVGDYLQNDRIFYAGRTGDGALNNATLSDAISTLNGSDLGLANNSEIAGTKWAVYWFPGLSAAPEAGGLQLGQSYGFYHSDQIDVTAAASFNATAAMVMPGDGEAVNTFYYDTETESTSFPSVQEFTADLTVVPEPSITAMLALIGFAISLRRRRKGDFQHASH